MRKMADQPRAEKQYLELDPTFRAGDSPGAAILSADWRPGALNLLLDQMCRKPDNIQTINIPGLI